MSWDAIVPWLDPVARWLLLIAVSINFATAWITIVRLRRVWIYEQLLQDLCVRSFVYGKVRPVWDVWEWAFRMRLKIVVEGREDDDPDKGG